MSLLLQPIQIKNIQIKNRIIMPPMATSKSKDGSITEDLINYYDDKSKGGYIGLIITEHAYISPEGKAGVGQTSVSKDSDIEGLKKIVEVIHKNGSKVFAQINHAGSSTEFKIIGSNPISASSVSNPGATAKPGVIPTEMTKNDIKNAVIKFGEAAKRVKEAGFDGVEIHSAHGYLLSQFFSPITNKRDDEYGGTLENRIRIHLEIIDEIRKKVGEDYIVALRLGAADYMENGTTLSDSIFAAQAFEKQGIDLLDISGGLCGYINPKSKEPGHFQELTKALKKNISIPIVLTGGIQTPMQAENLLNSNNSDFVGIGRAILKDSDWAKKALEFLK